MSFISFLLVEEDENQWQAIVLDMCCRAAETWLDYMVKCYFVSNPTNYISALPLYYSFAARTTSVDVIGEKCENGTRKGARNAWQHTVNFNSDNGTWRQLLLNLFYSPLSIQFLEEKILIEDKKINIKKMSIPYGFTYWDTEILRLGHNLNK